MPRAHFPRTDGFPLLRLGPIQVRAHASWLIWLLLLAGISRTYHGGGSNWAFHAFVALTLSACVVAHELAHSLVAIANGLPVRRITLFLLGGVSHIEREAPDARVEYQVALAGPLTSLVIATVVGGFAFQEPHGLHGTLGFISWVNWWLAIFNLLPAFPMDGGRILRSILWAVQHNRARATRIAAIVGRAFAVLLIASGALSFVLGIARGTDDPGAGIWTSMMGLFLYNAASAAERIEGGDRPKEPPVV